MKEAFGHKLYNERVIMITRKKRVPNKAPSVLIKYWDWMELQESVTKLSLSRQFMLNDATAGQVLNKFVEQGKLKMLPRGAHDKGVWVKV